MGPDDGSESGSTHVQPHDVDVAEQDAVPQLHKVPEDAKLEGADGMVAACVPLRLLDLQHRLAANGSFTTLNAIPSHQLATAISIKP